MERNRYTRRSLSPLIGVHNTENILSALLVAHIHGIDQQTIEMALKRFNGLPHRVEYVGEINGIRFYDDSKATNVDATRMAIEGMEDRGNHYCRRERIRVAVIR